MYSKQGKIIVEEIMSSPVVTGSVKESVMDLAKKMKLHDVDSVVILGERGEPEGIITEGDMVRRLLSKKRNLLFVKAKHVMSKPVLTVRRETTMEDAAQLMVSKRIRRLCVVDEYSKLVGIVTQADIIKNSNYLIGVLREMVDTGYVKGVETAEA